jgi:hypothetical protein
MMPAADMVHPSSCDIEEALDLLFLSPAYGPHSPLLNLHPGFDSDAFKDWSEANDMVASVYVALTADASNSHVSTVDNLCDVWESCTGGSSDRQSHSRMASSKKPRRQQTTLPGTLQRKSMKVKIDVERTLVAPMPCGGSLSAANFDKNEWEIMYPHFVEENLVDPYEHVNRKILNASYMCLDCVDFLCFSWCVIRIHVYVCVLFHFISFSATFVTSVYAPHLWARSLPALERLLVRLLWIDLLLSFHLFIDVCAAFMQAFV